MSADGAPRTDLRAGPWLVTGAGGMLGHDVLAALDREGVPAVGFARSELDVTSSGEVAAALREHCPAVVVNCAAWTAVDDAESREDEALAVNGEGPRVLAAACGTAGARLLHVSTDYVFAGDGSQPYGEDDPAAPRTAYGRTKLAGELAVRAALPDSGYVLRTAWLYGAAGPSFARTMIRLEGSRDTVDVVDDQLGQPTWTVDVADRLVALGRAAQDGSAAAGTYHATSAGHTSWYGFAREIFARLGADPGRVRPTTSEAFVRPAPRPAYSVLGHGRWHATGIAPIRDWRAALAEAMPALVAAERG